MPTYRLTLRAMRGPPHAVIRLRKALKTLLRVYRLRCVDVENVKDDSPPAKGGRRRSEGRLPSSPCSSDRSIPESLEHRRLPAEVKKRRCDVTSAGELF